MVTFPHIPTAREISPLRMNKRSALLATFLAFTCSVTGHAVDTKQLAAEYPLRIHVYTLKARQNFAGQALGFDQVEGKRNRNDRMSIGVNGHGSANLFEGGMPRGFDYTFDCPEGFNAQHGGDVYPAKWLKKDKELEVVVGYFGEKDRVVTCKLKTAMVEGLAYHKRRGHLVTTSIEERKQWMRDNDYDPEHGKTMIKPEHEEKD